MLEWSGEGLGLEGTCVVENEAGSCRAVIGNVDDVELLR